MGVVTIHILLVLEAGNDWPKATRQGSYSGPHVPDITHLACGHFASQRGSTDPGLILDLVLVSQGCPNKEPQTGRLKHQNFIVSQF